MYRHAALGVCGSVSWWQGTGSSSSEPAHQLTRREAGRQGGGHLNLTQLATALMVQKQKRVETVSAGVSITALAAVQCRAVPDLCDVAHRSFPQVLLDRSNGNCASLHQKHYC